MNPLFEGHKVINKSIVINIQKVFRNIDIEITDLQLYAIIIQGVLQRNFNKRKLAIKNNYYINPYIYTNLCIINCIKIFINIWYKNNESRMINRLHKKFAKEKNPKIIYGIIYLVKNRLSNFIVDVIQNEEVYNLKMKLDILSKKSLNLNISERYNWLLPNKPYHLQLVPKNDKNK